MKTLVVVGVALSVVAGCGLEQGPETETRAGALTHAEGAALVRFMNSGSTTLAVLDFACAIRSDSAANLIARRNGPDGVFGTGDDQPFTSPQDVDGVFMVGPWTMGRLTDCSDRYGFMPSADDLQLLAFMNNTATTTFAVLDVDCAIRSDSAANIIAHRSGPDGLPGTADDNLFDTAAELDSVFFVGPWTMGRLYDCAGVGQGPDYPDGAQCGAHQECASGLCAGLTVGYGFCQPAWMEGTFTTVDPAAAIPDQGGPGLSSTIEVSGLASVPEDVVVTIDLDHPRKEDLIVELHQPGGGYDLLWDRDPNPPAELSSLGVERDNMVNGTWTLVVTDLAMGETGTLDSWSLWLTSRYD